MATYRVIFFTPQPGRGWQIPVAAVTRGSEGTRLVLAQAQPDAGCAGGPTAHFMLERGTQLLVSTNPSMAELPRTLTDNFSLGLELAVPASDQEAATWVVQHVLPGLEKKDAPHAKYTHAGTQGRAFFKAQSIDHYVSDRFSFAKHVKLAPELAGVAETVTHWVERKDGTTLLLEPIGWSRDLSRQIRRVFSRYSGLIRLAEKAGAREQIETLAYVLPRAMPPGEEGRFNALLDVARVVDISNPSQCMEFVSEIKAQGVSHGQPMLN